MKLKNTLRLCGLGLAAAIAVGVSQPANAQTESKRHVLNPNAVRQTHEGWGVSLCWWANMCGNWDDAKIDEIVTWLTSPTGLNYNVFRYNIGGGDDPTHTHMRDGKGIRAEMQGFKVSADADYDWSRDEAQRKIMLKIKEKRPDAIFEAFSNSAPWWMTTSKCSSGNGTLIASANLPSSSYEAFANYLVDVCKHYKDEYGIEFRTLEPFNEPNSTFWKKNGDQEGCIFGQSAQVAFLKVLQPILAASGLNTVISAADENSISTALSGLKYYNSNNAQDLVGQWNTHSYSGTNTNRANFAALAHGVGKKVWQSETGPLDLNLNDAYAEELAITKRLFDDVRYMDCDAWIDWQYVEDWSEQWSMVVAPDFSQNNYNRTKNYYVREQVTRNISPGFRFISTDDDNTLAAIDPVNNRMIFVILNQAATEAKHEFSLSGCYASGTPAAYITSASQNYARYTSFSENDGVYSVSLPGQSIITFIINLAPLDEAPEGIADGGYYMIKPQYNNQRALTSSNGTLSVKDIVHGDAWENTALKSPVEGSIIWKVKSDGDGGYTLTNGEGAILYVDGTTLKSTTDASVAEGKNSFTLSAVTPLQYHIVTGTRAVSNSSGTTVTLANNSTDLSAGQLNWNLIPVAVVEKEPEETEQPVEPDPLPSDIDYANWMADMPDAALVTTLSIPGTHDSATSEGFKSSLSAISGQTQDLKLDEQFNLGVRALDLRPGLEGNNFYCWHGVARLNITMEDALKKVTAFLDQHPTEFFIIHLFPGNNSNGATIKDPMNALLAQEDIAPYLIPFRPGLTVGEMRGKMIFIKRWDFDEWKSPYEARVDNWNHTQNDDGLTYVYPNGTIKVDDNTFYYEPALCVQDLAQTNSTALMNAKIKAMQDLVDYTSAIGFPNRNTLTWAFNFLSAYTGSISLASGYAENANRLNKEMIDKITSDSYNPGPLGVVMIDWVGGTTHQGTNTYGEQVVHTIIDNNYRYINQITPQVAPPLFTRVDRNSGVLKNTGYRGNLEFVDFDNDGYLDLLQRHRLANQSFAVENNVYFNIDGNFSQNVKLSDDGIALSRVAVPLDYNRDGRVDLLYGLNTSKLATNNGNGEFKWNNTIVLPASTTLAMTDAMIEQRVDGLLIPVDIDLNGYPELITYDNTKTALVDPMAGMPTMYANDKGTFTAATNVELPKVKGGTIAVGDIDNDGRADLLISGQDAAGTNQVWVSLNRTENEGEYAFENIHLEGLAEYATYHGAVALADLDNDGLLDIVLTGATRSSGRSFNILMNKGDLEFEAVKTSKLSQLRYSSLDIKDINGDGYLDIAYTGDASTGALTGVMMNQGDGTFADFNIDFMQFNGGGNVRIADYNKNGYPSIAFMGIGKNNDHFALYDQIAAGKKALADLSAEKVEATLTEDAHGRAVIEWTNDLGSEYRFNYVLKLEDGSIVYAVPVLVNEDNESGALLMSRTHTAVGGEKVTLNVKYSDVLSYGVHAIAPDGSTTQIYLTEVTYDGTVGAAFEINDKAPVEYYDLQGRKVENPGAGIYIERRGGKVVKRIFQ